MSKPHSLFTEIVDDFKDAELGQMFGKECGKIGKKAFVAFFEDEMVFRIGREEMEDRLKTYRGSQLFDPSRKNRPFKDWIQIPYIYSDKWKTLAQDALEFTSKL